MLDELLQFLRRDGFIRAISTSKIARAVSFINSTLTFISI